MSDKTIEDYFADWEAHVFGYGYGTGEGRTIPALKEFLGACPASGGYDYKELERSVGNTVAWLLINTLCHADVFEYGSSPRYAWFTPKGERLRAFIAARSVNDLLSLVDRDDVYSGCDPFSCNCGPNGYEKGRVCQNPFFLDNLNSQYRGRKHV